MVDLPDKLQNDFANNIHPSKFTMGILIEFTLDLQYKVILRGKNCFIQFSEFLSLIYLSCFILLCGKW